MKNKKTIEMMLLGALLALSSCAKSAGVAAVSGLNPTDGSNTTDTTPEFTGMQAADEIENEDPGKRAELAELYKKRGLLQDQIDIVNKRIKAHKTWAWITNPLGILTTGAGVYFLVSSEEAYKNYQDTSETRTISKYKEQGALYEPLGYSLGGGGLALTVYRHHISPYNPRSPET